LSPQCRAKCPTSSSSSSIYSLLKKTINIQIYLNKNCKNNGRLNELATHYENRNNVTTYNTCTYKTSREEMFNKKVLSLTDELAE